MFDAIRHDFELVLKTNCKEALTWNRNKCSLSTPGTHDRFIKLFDLYGSLAKAYDYTVNWKYDVGIYGVVCNPNYGGLLTYYALYKVIESLGYSVLLINSPEGLNEFGQTHSTLFFESHTTLSIRRTIDNQKEINSHVSKIVLGSDQVWNYALFKAWKELLYLSFVEDTKNIISYAPSFGHDKHTIPQGLVCKIAHYINRFDSLSIREFEGESILLNDFGFHSTSVLDPVFLMDQMEYDKLVNDSKLNFDYPYIGSYLLDPNDLKLDILTDIVKRLSLAVVNMTDGDPQAYKRKSVVYENAQLPLLNNVTIEDWIKVIRNSSFFVTDSFHAACICIMFKKKFILLQENWALSRIKTLMDVFNLHNRWISIKQYWEYTFNDAWLEPLDYISIDKIWTNEKERCLNWLKLALQCEKQSILCNISYNPVSIEELLNVYSNNTSCLLRLNRCIISNGKLVNDDKISIYIKGPKEYSFFENSICKLLDMGTYTIHIISDSSYFDYSCINAKKYRWSLLNKSVQLLVFDSNGMVVDTYCI